MIGHRGLPSAGDDADLLDSRAGNLLNRILDKGLVDHSQHLFRLGLGRWQEPGAESRGGYDSFSNVHRVVL